MSLPPPPGYAICSATFAKTGQPHQMVITLAVKYAIGLNAAQVQATWRSAISGSNARPFHVSNMIVGWSIVETYVLHCSAGGVLTSDTSIVPLVGTKVANGMPVNTSVVVTKNVTPVGRQYRGRILFVPSYLPSTAVDSDGIIAGANLTALQTLVTGMITVFTGAGYLIVLLHQPPQGGGATPAPTTVNNLTVNPRIGTIRHRIRR